MRSRRWFVPVGWATSILAVAVAATLATRATLEVPSAADQSAAPALYRVSEGTVSRVQSFTAEAKWDSDPIGRNGASGTVTTIDIEPGDVVASGQRLYSVNLRPAIAAMGAIPSFRDLRVGSVGADVTQLQRFLSDADYYQGSLTGSFDEETARAVEAWQRDLGVTDDGTVRHGDLFFLPELPIRVTTVDDLQVGAPLSGGEIVVSVLSSEPSFTVTLSADQSGLVPLDAAVILHHPGGTWTGRIGSATTAANGELVLLLEGPDGTALCDSECGAVPIGDPSLYTADLVAVPETTGPVVPVAALRTRPDGTVTVLEESCQQIGVTVRAAAEGRAVVSGVRVGTIIRLFGLDASSATPPAAPDSSAASVGPP